MPSSQKMTLQEKLQTLTTRESVCNAITKTLKSDHIHKKIILNKLFSLLAGFVPEDTELPTQDIAQEAYLEFTYNKLDILE